MGIDYTNAIQKEHMKFIVSFQSLLSDLEIVSRDVGKMARICDEKTYGELTAKREYCLSGMQDIQKDIADINKIICEYNTKYDTIEENYNYNKVIQKFIKAIRKSSSDVAHIIDEKNNLEELLIEVKSKENLID